MLVYLLDYVHMTEGIIQVGIELVEVSSLLLELLPEGEEPIKIKHVSCDTLSPCCSVYSGLSYFSCSFFFM